MYYQGLSHTFVMRFPGYPSHKVMRWKISSGARVKDCLPKLSCAFKPEQLFHSLPIQSSAGQGHYHSTDVLAPPSVIYCTITYQRDEYVPVLNSWDVALSIKEAEELICLQLSEWKRSLCFHQSQTLVLPWLAQATVGARMEFVQEVTSGTAVSDLRLCFQGSTCRGRGCRRAH